MNPVTVTQLPDASRLDSVAAAVLAEHRACSKTARLRCQSIDAVESYGDVKIYSLRVTRFATLDWSWEGAWAYYAPEEDDFDVDEWKRPLWSGEVVEVDDVESCVYIKTDGHSPTVGDFLVRPFDYLSAMRDVYCGELAFHFEAPLADALPWTAGEQPPRRISNRSRVSSDAWNHDRGYIWGPPGTGKTHTIGEVVATAIEDPDEHILVLSTTNKATDQAAVSIANALRRRGIEPTPDELRRVGSGADGTKFRAEGLADLLDAGADELRELLANLLQRHRRSTDPIERAQLWAQAQEVRLQLSSGRGALTGVESSVIVTTSFLGMRGLPHEETAVRIERGDRPFTSVIIDEASLISRAAVAALSLWASRRVLLVGDPRQLSPISRISRVLEPQRAQWLARSGLDHLYEPAAGVDLLTTQFRMHPEVRGAVSKFSYRDALTDAPDVLRRDHGLDTDLADGPRAIWYVLDEDAGTIPWIRADRGPGGKSWVRKRSKEIMERLLRLHPSLAEVEGLFVTPFVAQARELTAWFGEQDLSNWHASTTHAQQGAEARVVVFDTVNASSTAWSHGEWQRLINVGISRARELVIVLASRLEMSEPYLRALGDLLSPRVIRGSGGKLGWLDVDRDASIHTTSSTVREQNPARLGGQIEQRKAMRPILGAEQQRLCLLPIDGKPRLVRGVAGSGKTAVLAHWLCRRVLDEPGPLWVIYANKSLAGLIQDVVGYAWTDLEQEGAFPWDRVELLHVLDLLDRLEAEHHIRSSRRNSYEFEKRADALLATEIQPRCKAMFVDEAQDLGESTLALLAKLVEPSDPSEPGQRAINIFYDNAQNVYGRGTPRWVDLGLDMQGRSTVMKESYRSTRPVTEFAMNVLYRLEPPETDPDHVELVKRDLVHIEERNDRPWWRVRFNEIDGPAPDFRRFGEREAEIDALVQQVTQWIAEDGVRPGDIRVIANTKQVRTRVLQALEGPLARLDARIEQRQRDRIDFEDDVVLVTTAHSFKGHDAEVVAVPCADKFTASIDGTSTLLGKVLYVAMTRARSLLYISAMTRASGSPGADIVEALQTAFEDQRTVPDERELCTTGEEHLELVARIGEEHKGWLGDLARKFELETGPICRANGSIAAEPVFWFRTERGIRACFERAPTTFIRHELQDLGIGILLPGEFNPENPDGSST